jgi:ribosomal protein L29
VTARQIEAARIAMTRHVKRGGKIWIRVFPDKPITKKPPRPAWARARATPRSGWRWSSPPDPLRDGGGPEEVAREAMRLAAHKLPIKTRFVTRTQAVMKAKEDEAPFGSRPLDELQGRCRRLAEQLFKLRLPEGHGADREPGQDPSGPQDIARVLTVLRERAGGG